MSQSIDARYADMLRGREIITRLDRPKDKKRKAKARRKSANVAKARALVNRLKAMGY